MRRDWGRPGVEPGLEEALADPIVRLVLRRDRLTADDVRAVIEEVQRRHRDASDASDALPRSTMRAAILRKPQGEALPRHQGTGLHSVRSIARLPLPPLAGS